MAKRKDGVGRPTDIERDLAAERERNRELEEKIRILESEPGASPSIGESVEAGEANQVRPTGADGLSGELPDEDEPVTTPGVWVNEKGHLCIGRECIVAEATPEGLRFRLDPDTCDPKTREAFVEAMLKGTRIGLKE